MEIGELYAKYYAILLCGMISLTKEPALAEDVVQESFLRAMKDGSFKALSEVQQRAWLFRTGRRLFIDKTRHRAIQEREALRERRENAAEDDLSLIAVRQLLDRLPTQQRELVVLRYFSGWTSTEIGKYQHLSPATVRTRLRAAVLKLRKYYDEE